MIENVYFTNPSHKAYSAKDVIVSKMDERIYFSSHYTKRNLRTIKDAYPVPRFGDIMHNRQFQIRFHSRRIGSLN